MSCERVQALIGLGPELDRADQLLLRRHLQDCAACQAAAIQEERVRAYLSGLPDLPVPTGLQARLLAIPEAAVPASPWASLPLAGRNALLLAAALVAALGLWLSLRPRGPALLQPPADPFLAPSSGTPVGGPSRLAQAQPTAARTDAAGLAATEDAAVAAAVRPASSAQPSSAPARAAGPRARSAPPAAPFGGVAGLSTPATDADGESSGAADDEGGEPRPPREPASAPPPLASAQPPSAATEAPPAASPVPTACISFSAEVFLDLAGEGPRPCAGCDGVFDEADEAAAQAAGLSLPNALLSWVDALELEGEENLVLASSGAKAHRDGIQVCGVLPINVDLTVGLPEDGSLALCPSSGRRYLLGAQDDGAVLRWGIGLATCPLPTITPPSQEAETPAAPPSVEPGETGPPPDPLLLLSSGIVSAMP